MRTKGVSEHIRKELDEIAADPTDVKEWIDVIILGLDGYWRAGGCSSDIAEDLCKKQDRNFARKWPTPTSEDVAVEHIRDDEAAAIASKALEVKQ